MNRGIKYMLPAVFLAALILVLVGCTKGPTIPSTFPAAPGSTEGPASFTVTLPPSASPSTSNGERIYTTSTSASGQPITYTGGPGMMMQTALSCANCHGPEGRGGTVYFMMQSYDIPDITWPVLTGADMDHPPYTVETLKGAITEGLDPGGNPLEYPMPRWQMSAQDLNDLAAYIMTLK
jgi:cytochrome c oxidase subunit 2